MKTLICVKDPTQVQRTAGVGVQLRLFQKQAGWILDWLDTPFPPPFPGGGD